MTDSYPEYLNPFAEESKPKSKLSISHSFKELRRTLRQSFRIKKKEEEVTVRQKTETLRRVPASYPPPQIALPRSRFHERVSKCEPSTSTPPPNPFEDEEEKKKGEVMTKRRRGKKRAPQPPKSSSSQDVHDHSLAVPSRGSNWSLSSDYTDYSDSVYNISGNELEMEASRESLAEKFLDFNKEMEKLKEDDSNNNIITKEDITKEPEPNSDIPDLVISCPNDTESTKPKTDQEVINSPQTHSVADSTKVEKNNDDDSGASETDSENSKELNVTDITNNLIIDEKKTVNNSKDNDEHKDEENEENKEELLYHEKKSLYIAGSRDELNESNVYTGRVSLYITGSSDNLDVCNNNEVSNKYEIDENSYDDAAIPVPKQRKNKLTRNTLLGM